MPIVGPFLTYTQVVSLWIASGGNPLTAWVAAGVAMAESRGGTHSYHDNDNGSTDYGLWQINSASNGGSTADFDPSTVAKAAIRISKDGTDWRQWCTAWTDGACGHKGGVYAPTGGSPAGVYYKRFRGVTGAAAAPKHPLTTHQTTTIVPASETPTIDEHLTDAWHHLTHAFGVTVPTRVRMSNHRTRALWRVVR